MGPAAGATRNLKLNLEILNSNPEPGCPQVEQDGVPSLPARESSILTEVSTFTDLSTFAPAGPHR